MSFALAKNIFTRPFFTTSKKVPGPYDDEIYADFLNMLHQKKPLVPKSNFVVPGTGDIFDPNGFPFEDDGFLTLGSDFDRYILPVVEKVNLPQEGLAVESFDLSKNLDHTWKELNFPFPKERVFDPSIFCWFADIMTRRQPGGERGELVTSFGNRFHVKGIAGIVFEVTIYWHSNETRRQRGHSGYLGGKDHWSQNGYWSVRAELLYRQFTSVGSRYFLPAVPD